MPGALFWSMWHVHMDFAFSLLRPDSLYQFLSVTGTGFTRVGGGKVAYWPAILGLASRQTSVVDRRI
jgi:hypothetical protein